MFREMRRINQQISNEDCISLLKLQKRGVLSVIGDDGYSYGIPIDHYYDEEKNKLYFHCAKEGHKIDAIKKCNKVCYCTYDEGYLIEGEWPLHIKSVIIFGKAKEIVDIDIIIDVLKKLSDKFTDDEEFVKGALERSLKRVACFEVEIEHMSGKLVKES